ncbi:MULTISPECIES: phosphotransferase family protein [unclassified Streptomyces]|uniref:phosphotransferase family protein n=1 Tax=unclassified Streptomyces TaxID=2593676 RepID=UPI002DD9FE2B|nr:MULTISPECIES: phosphotransferase family protein [unclassified Streptomyces]WSA96103.1 phosphotransferase family protein [Streptomyces sp. NBC_01795]WSB80518.1 phosphotransferase family protein [Streptomyces sp. NBC_01775]WSS11275.1 phosphotransferase family protein [Streptomyces sp. NBC_01186]WSS39985.1 phosphotransferase family protein [Streptomyces sp. NBC_01187]
MTSPPTPETPGTPRTPVVGIDGPALQSYFERHVPECAGPLRARLLQGGRSNLTYELTDGTHRWVLRRPPLGNLTPTAHDMDREYRVVAALGRTGVPVARAVLSCTDPTVIGAPFCVVDFVAGPVLRDGEEAARLPPADARRGAEALVDALVALHSVDAADVGLGDFGRPDGYLERQVRRWRSQWDKVATRGLPDLGELHGRLARALPASGAPAVVHGDYRLDNTILAPGDFGRIAAIVDWEMATLGDPLADLGMLLMYWEPVCEPVLGTRHVPTSNPGFPSGRELAERYAEKSGRDIAAVAFYQALGYFKLAVIAEGIHARYLAGRTVGTGFERVGSAVPALLRSGLELLA